MLENKSNIIGMFSEEVPIIGFVKEHGAWYADLPEYIEQGGSKAACLMVSGAPELIEMLAGGKEVDYFKAAISPNYFPEFDAVMNKSHESGDVIGEEGNWGFYKTTIYNEPLSNQLDGVNLASVSLMVGLCPVASFLWNSLGIMNGHVNTIYLKAIKE